MTRGCYGWENLLWFTQRLLQYWHWTQTKPDRPCSTAHRSSVLNLFSLPIQTDNNLVPLGHQLKRTLIYYRLSLLSGSQQRTVIYTLVKGCLHLPENTLPEVEFLQQEAGWKEGSWKYSKSVQHWYPLSHAQFSGHKCSGQSSRCYWLCHQIGSQHI